jgi:mannan endo-1,4-beta-mannosidase
LTRAAVVGAVALRTLVVGLLACDRAPSSAAVPEPPDPAPSAAPAATWTVDGATLRDPCGDAVVLRGVNHPTMFVDRPGDALPEIAATGANAVRLFWVAGADVPVSAAEPAIARAIALGMVPMLEMHDSTCKWELAGIVDAWTAPGTVAMIDRHRDNLLVNLANEASTDDDDAFERDTIAAIVRMREAGIRVPIVIDATKCGRNLDLLLARGPALIAADPEHAIVLSWHAWDPLPRAELDRAAERIAASGLPIVIGEFGPRSPPGCGAPIDLDGLLAAARRHELGWLAWSWGDDAPGHDWNTDCGEFDMVDTFAHSSLRGWGRRVALDSSDGIAQTSVRTAWQTTGRCARPRWAHVAPVAGVR